MNILEKLAFHEKNQLQEWVELDYKTSTKLLKEVAKYADSNSDSIKQYCKSITAPTEYSSLSIVYEALSTYSNKFNDFLYEEIKRIISLVKQGKVAPVSLEILSDIDIENIYIFEQDIYIDIINYLIDNLELNNDKRFIKELLDVIYYYLLEYDTDEKIPEAEKWISKLKYISDNTNGEIKEKVIEILNDLLDIDNSTSFFEKLKNLFK